jgi:cell division protein FtsI (penicillin-binding protein 3)
MLREVVLKGTGKRAQLNGYTAGGKTGTAWKYDEKLKKINENKYVSSFGGIAPLDNPAVVIVVVIDEPTVAGRDGGQVAAPVFREIAEQILPEMNIVPDGTIRQEVLSPDEVPAEMEVKSTKSAAPETAKSDKKVKAPVTVQKPAPAEAKKEKPVTEKSKAKPKTARIDAARRSSLRQKMAALDRTMFFEKRREQSIRRNNIAAAAVRPPNREEVRLQLTFESKQREKT